MPSPIEETNQPTSAGITPIMMIIVAMATGLIVGSAMFYWQQMKVRELTDEKTIIEADRDTAKKAAATDRETIDTMTKRIDQLTTDTSQMKERLAEQMTTKETTITAENAISWTSGNNAKVSLTKVHLSGTGATRKLDLYFDVTTTDGGYCWQSMDTYLRITDEKGTYVNPDTVAEKCANGYSTLKDQKVSFPVAESQKNFDVFNRGRDASGGTAMKKMFSVYDDSFRVVGYPQ